MREEGWEVAVTGGGWVTAVWEEGRELTVTGGLGGGGEGGRSGGGEGDECVTIAVTAVHACMCGGWVRDHCSHSCACMHVSRLGGGGDGGGWMMAVREKGWEVAVMGVGWVTTVREEGREWR